MDGLTRVLRTRQDTIMTRWCQEALAVYANSAALAFDRERDPFANPIGHSLRTGTRALFEALLAGADDEQIRRSLDDILRTRAIQQLRPAEAIRFLFHLKELIRQELAPAPGDPGPPPDLTDWMRRIDHAVLIAFDVYVAHRERLCELRIAEVKRTIPWSVARGRTG